MKNTFSLLAHGHSYGVNPLGHCCKWGFAQEAGNLHSVDDVLGRGALGLMHWAIGNG